MTLTTPSDDILERITEAFCNDRKGDGIVFRDVYQHNACNHTLSGTIIAAEDGLCYGFVIEMGDWVGCEVRAWGLADDVATFTHPPAPEPVTFVPVNPFLFTERPEMFKVYASWRKEEWFKEKERGFNYDRHFQPGGYVERHYAEWAAKKGLKAGYLSSMSEAELAVIRAN